MAEPQVELWVESGKDVSPAEAGQAAADARAALEQALAGRSLGDGSQLLVVRAQGVSRTRSRRTDQKAAVAGLVVAAVVVVAVAVVALVATAKSGGKTPSARPAPAPDARPAPAPGAVATHPAPAPAAIPRPAPPPPVPPPPVAVRPPPRPSGSPGHGEVGVAFGANIEVVVPPAPNGVPPAVWSESVETGPPAAPPPPPPAPGPAELVLPPPPPLEVERRGFFAGDTTRLELTLVDRATMRPLWVKVVESKRDPRDAKAVRELLDGALADPGGWLPAAAEAPGS